MKLIRNVVLTAALAAGAIWAAAAAAPPAQAQITVTFSYFQDRLAPHGEWVSHPRWGLVWSPRGVAADWRPYLHGRWVWTDEYGWYWLSDEDWGWATYHYGRWARDPRFGWIWVPGYTWGPGWVAWRLSDAYVGWAALPPQVDVDDDGELAWHDADLLADPYHAFWVFVPGRLFLANRLGLYTFGHARNAGLLRETRDVTRFGRRNGRMFNPGPEPNRIVRRFGRRVPVMRVQLANTPATARRALRGDTVRIFRPNVRRNAALQQPNRTDRPARVNRTPGAAPTPPATRQHPATRQRPETRPNRLRREAPPARREPQAAPRAIPPRQVTPPIRRQPAARAPETRRQPAARPQQRQEWRRAPRARQEPRARRQPETRPHWRQNRPQAAPQRPQARQTPPQARPDRQVRRQAQPDAPRQARPNNARPNQSRQAPARQNRANRPGRRDQDEKR